jgi:hypothetical protein
MMRRAAAIALAGLLAACGGKKASGDPLAHCGNGLCGDGPLFAVTSLALVAGDGHGHSAGFHLAGADTGACPSSNLTSPTGGVVDNQIANVLPVLYGQIGNALPTLVQNAVNDGGLSVILEIVGDPTRDTTVDLVMHHGFGVPLLGADGLFLADQTVALAAEPPLGICRGAKVSDGALSCGPFTAAFPIVVFGVRYDLTLEEVLMTMTLPTDGSDPQLLWGGAITVENIQQIATTAGPGAGNLMPIVQTVVPGLADIADPVTGNCDRISGALTMIVRSTFAMGGR